MTGCLNFNLMVFWKLDETSCSTAGDSSGNSRDGTLVNMEDGDCVIANSSVRHVSGFRKAHVFVKWLQIPAICCFYVIFVLSAGRPKIQQDITPGIAIAGTCRLNTTFHYNYQSYRSFGYSFVILQNLSYNVTVSAVNDTFNEGQESASISISTLSDDPNFDGRTVPAIDVSVVDDDHDWPCIRSVGWYWWSMSGYMPPAQVRYEALTHIEYNPHYELTVATDGHIVDTGTINNNLAELVAAAHANRVKVLMMFGEVQEDFTIMIQQPSNRETFVLEALAYVLAHNLDGVNFDWERQVTQQDIQNYTDLIIETKTAFAPHNLLVSVCGHPSSATDRINADALPYLDYINLSSFGNITETGIFEALNIWIDFGADPLQLNSGLGFFGWKPPNSAVNYSDILKMCPDLQPEDDWCGDYHFTGQTSCQQRALYIIDKGYGGLFYFQLNYDNLDDRSLLKAVGDTVRAYGGFCPSYLNADFDGDGDVDLLDLACFVSWWMECTQPGEADCQDVR